MKRLLRQLGFTGLASIALLGAALLFSNVVVEPLEARSGLLKETAGREARKTDASQSGDKVAAVYEFLQKDEDTTDWLAKLHGIGVATGVQLKSANYRTQKTEGRIVRYEIVLPVAGSYTQIRDFLKRSLAEIPVLSVDQLTLRREESGSGKNSGAIQAEMRLTLHMVKS
jgi:Tfp pilus assembly protein PilO